MRPTADQRDHDILANRRAAYNTIAGPRVGDWCIMLDGTTRRFTYDWGDGLQTTCIDGESGSFHLGEADRNIGGGVYMSYSGSLSRSIPRERIAATGETRDGRIWFFHHNHHCADNAVEFSIPFRVFRELATDDDPAACAKCPGRDHREHVADVCNGTCCTSCGGPIDENEACRC